VSQIDDRLRQLPPDKLSLVLDFVSYLVDRQLTSESFQTMLASESVLKREWDQPMEDDAWADL